jgi:hypothetical protein
MDIFDLNMMVKSGLDFLILKFAEPFRVATAQYQKICPLGLNWLGRLAGISEGARWISKQIPDHFSPSLLKPKMLISRLEILVHFNPPLTKLTYLNVVHFYLYINYIIYQQ